MGRAGRWNLILGALLVTINLAASAQHPESSAPQPEQPVAAALRIGAGDLVDVTMYDAPELSGRFRVDEKGEIKLPLIGIVRVQDHTAVEASDMIQKRYVEGEILTPERAQATVFIEEYANQGITVAGEVKSAGVVPALGIRMLNDVITAAGGVTPAASSKVIITRRGEPEHKLTVEYNPTALKPVIPQVQIFPGDMVMVPRAGMVYLAGEVSRPGGYVLEGRKTMTLMEVMALGGNAAHAASLHRVELIRSLPDQRKEMMILRLDKILKGKAPDIALKDGDILFVPTSKAKLYTEQAITSMVTIGTSIAIYRAAVQ